MEECIFCRIANGKAPAEVLFQDERALVIRDINPIAPIHLLVIPKRHITSLNDAHPADEADLGYLFLLARQTAEEAGVDLSGYRLVLNTGPDAGQSVQHLHLHLLGGRRLSFRTQ